MEAGHNPGSDPSQSSIMNGNGSSSADDGARNHEEDEKRLQAQRDMQMVSGIAPSASYGPNSCNPALLFDLSTTCLL